MTGGKAALWDDEDMADDFTHEAVSFIERNKDKPFFLFFSLHDNHVPRVPHPRFVGKSGQGPRGDAVVQFDWCAGQIIKTLEKHGLSKNTLVILTSDNGPVLDDGYKDQANELLGERISVRLESRRQSPEVVALPRRGGHHTATTLVRWASPAPSALPFLASMMTLRPTHSRLAASRVARHRLTPVSPSV